MKRIIKEIYHVRIYILVLVGFLILFNIKLPYYVMTPGGIINITNRIEVNDNSNESDGSINLLYVSEYEGTVVSLFLAKLLKNWDIEPIKDMQLSDEDARQIQIRNKVMLDNSVDIATIVAYQEASKNINITGYDNIIVGTTSDNNLKIGDKIVSVDNINIKDISDIKKIISSKEIGDTLLFKVLRDNKEEEIVVEIKNEAAQKVIGVVVITNYEYELDPKIDIMFKSSESGASGGLMMALAIYNSISEDDIIKGRRISGTGTIDINGIIGEIDGVKYKVMGAVKNNMDLIIVPEGNYEEALQVKKDFKYDIDIIKVRTFTEALNYLKS